MLLYSRSENRTNWSIKNAHEINQIKPFEVTEDIRFLLRQMASKNSKSDDNTSLITREISRNINKDCWCDNNLSNNSNWNQKGIHLNVEMGSSRNQFQQNTQNGSINPSPDGWLVTVHDINSA